MTSLSDYFAQRQAPAVPAPTPSDDDVIAAQQAQDAAAARRFEAQNSPFHAGLDEGVSSFGDQLTAAKGLGQAALGYEQPAVATLRRAQQGMQQTAQYAPENAGTLTDAYKSGNLGTYAQYKLGSLVPGLAATVGAGLATGGVGGLAAGALRTGAAEAAGDAAVAGLSDAAGGTAVSALRQRAVRTALAASKTTGFKVGEAAGVTGAGAVQATPSVVDDVLNDPHDGSTLQQRAQKGLAASAGVGVISALPNIALLARYGLAGQATKAVAEKVGHGMLARIAANAGEQGAIGAGAAGATVAVDRATHAWITGHPSAAPALPDYINGIADGALGGAVFGAPAGFKGERSVSDAMRAATSKLSGDLNARAQRASRPAAGEAVNSDGSKVDGDAQTQFDANLAGLKDNDEDHFAGLMESVKPYNITDDGISATLNGPSAGLIDPARMQSRAAQYDVLFKEPAHGNENKPVGGATQRAIASMLDDDQWSSAAVPGVKVAAKAFENGYSRLAPAEKNTLASFITDTLNPYQAEKFKRVLATVDAMSPDTRARVDFAKSGSDLAAGSGTPRQFTKVDPNAEANLGSISDSQWNKATFRQTKGGPARSTPDEQNVRLIRTSKNGDDYTSDLNVMHVASALAATPEGRAQLEGGTGSRNLKALTGVLAEARLRDQHIPASEIRPGLRVFPGEGGLLSAGDAELIHKYISRSAKKAATERANPVAMADAQTETPPAGRGDAAGAPRARTTTDKFDLPQGKQTGLPEVVSLKKTRRDAENDHTPEMAGDLQGLTEKSANPLGAPDIKTTSIEERRIESTARRSAQSLAIPGAWKKTPGELYEAALHIKEKVDPQNRKITNPHKDAVLSSVRQLAETDPEVARHMEEADHRKAVSDFAGERITGDNGALIPWLKAVIAGKKPTPAQREAFNAIRDRTNGFADMSDKAKTYARALIEKVPKKEQAKAAVSNTPEERASELSDAQLKKGLSEATDPAWRKVLEAESAARGTKQSLGRDVGSDGKPRPPRNFDDAETRVEAYGKEGRPNIQEAQVLHTWLQGKLDEAVASGDSMARARALNLVGEFMEHYNGHVKEALKGLPPEQFKAISDVVKARLGDLVHVDQNIDLNGSAGGEFTVDTGDNTAVITLYSALSHMYENDPTKTALHEVGHAAVSLFDQTLGRKATARMMKLADTPEINRQLRESSLNQKQFDYFMASPEERFVEAYAQWSAGKLKLSESSPAKGLFEKLKAFFAKLRGDMTLKQAFEKIESGDLAKGPKIDTARAVTRMKDPRFISYDSSEGKATRTAHDKLAEDIHKNIHGNDPEAGFGASHSSPTRHEGKFNWREHKGKGEGVAAFGEGTYLSTGDGVAKHYKAMFKPEDTAVHDIVPKTAEGKQLKAKLDAIEKEYDKPGGLGEQMDAAHAKYMELMTDSPFGEDDPPELKAARELYESLFEKVTALSEKTEAMGSQLRKAENIAEPSAPQYQVTVKAGKHEIMDWNKPLSEQHPEVQKKLATLGFSNGEKDVAPTEFVKHTGGGPTTWTADAVVGGKKVQYLIEQTNTGLFDTYRRDAGTFDNEVRVGHQLPEKFAQNVAGEDARREARKRSDPKGEDIYERLAGTHGSEENASDVLQKAGIVGHRYPAIEGSDSVHPNYVIYDDSRIHTNATMFDKDAPAAKETVDSNKEQIERLEDSLYRITADIVHSAENKGANRIAADELKAARSLSVEQLEAKIAEKERRLQKLETAYQEQLKKENDLGLSDETLDHRLAAGAFQGLGRELHGYTKLLQIKKLQAADEGKGKGESAATSAQTAKKETVGSINKEITDADKYARSPPKDFTAEQAAKLETRMREVSTRAAAKRDALGEEHEHYQTFDDIRMNAKDAANALKEVIANDKAARELHPEWFDEDVPLAEQSDPKGDIHSSIEAIQKTPAWKAIGNMLQDLKNAAVDVKSKVREKSVLRTLSKAFGVSEPKLEYHTGKHPAFITTDGRISLNTSLKGAARVSSLLHEFGHHLVNEKFSSASTETKKALIADYKTWRRAQGNDAFSTRLSRAPLFSGLRLLDELGGRTPATRDQLSASDARYLVSAHEYFADSIARALEQHEGVQSAEGPVGRFMSKVAQVTKLAYDLARSHDRRLTDSPASVRDWVHSLYEAPAEPDAAHASPASASGSAPRANATDADSLSSALSPQDHGTLFKVFGRRDVMTQLLTGADKDTAEALGNGGTQMKTAINEGFNRWASGRLDLTDKSVMAPLNNLREAVKKMLGIATNKELAERILRDAQEGKYDPTRDTRKVVEQEKQAALTAAGKTNTVAIRKAVFGTTQFVNLKMKPIAARFVSSLDERIRATNVPSLHALANIVHRQTGERGTGQDLGNAMQQARAQWWDRASKLIDTIPEADRQAVVKAAQAQKVMSDPRLEAHRQAMIRLLKAAGDYQRDKGVVMGDIKDYIPVVVDPEKVRADSIGFKAMLSEPKLEAGMRRYFKEVLKWPDADTMSHMDMIEHMHEMAVYKYDYSRGGESYDRTGSEEEPSSGVNMPERGKETQPRVSEFIYREKDPVLNEQFSKYQTDDIEQLLIPYMSHATRRAEFTSALGRAPDMKVSTLSQLLANAKKEGATPAQIQMAKDYVNAATGSYAPGLNPFFAKTLGSMDRVFGTKLGDMNSQQYRNLSNAIIAYQNLRVLGLGLFGNLIDPLGVWTRSSSVSQTWKGYKAAFTATAGKNPSYLRGLAEALGVVEAHATTEALSYNYGSAEGDNIKGWSQRVNRALFKVNGMEMITNFARLAATETGNKFLLAHAEGLNAHSDRYLKELGLTAADIKEDPQHPGYVKRNAKVDQALYQFVNESVLRPTPTQKPLWHNDPHFAVASQYKGYLYSFYATITERMLHEVHNGNASGVAPIAGYLAVSMAAELAREMVQFGPGGNPNRKDWGGGDYMKLVANRSGLAGPKLDTGIGSVSDVLHGSVPLASITGPSVGQAQQLGNVLFGHGSAKNAAIESLPGQSLYHGWVEGHGK